jgi:hypothetical protein
VLRKARSPLPGVDPRRVPMGMYAGNPPLPQNPRVVLVDQLHESLMGPPGIRLAMSTNRGGRYFGTDAVPAPRYPTGPPKVNRPQDLEMAPVQALAPRGGFPR